MMIERLSGLCIHRGLTKVVIDINGIGYGVELPEPLLAGCVVNTPLTVWVYSHHTEKGMQLYGFQTLDERLLFQTMLGVSGVGPKAAMSLMSKLGAEGLVRAVINDDEESVRGAKGIGAKAKKILLDLKPKFKKLNEQGLLDFCKQAAGASLRAPAGAFAKGNIDPNVMMDLRSALENLGYKDKEIQPVLWKLERHPPAQDFAGLVKAALAELVTGSFARDAATESSADEELF